LPLLTEQDYCFFIYLKPIIMAKYDFKLEKNPNTGETMAVCAMHGELISIASKPIPNKLGTSFYPATVEYLDAQDNLTKTGCLVYENNHKYGMSVGKTYLGKIIFSKGKPLPLLVLSHLDRAGNATADTFAFDFSMFDVADFDAVTTKK
jgi:hypothetical protein